MAVPAYNKFRSYILQRVQTYLENVQRIKEQGHDPPKFNDFQRDLMLETGVTPKMLKNAVETLVPGGTIEDGEIVRRGE